MFIDAHYQPHSSSVRVAALAAMSPTTPTHLVLPPHTGGGWGRVRRDSNAALPFRMLMEDVDRSPCVLLHNQRRGQPCDYLFIRFLFPPLPFTPSCLQESATPPPPPLPSHCPRSSPICDAEAAIFSRRLPRAFTLTRDTHDKLGVEVKVMACESNAPASTLHTVDIYTKAG